MALMSETRGYEYNSKNPTGRCLLEARSGTGKIILWAQDLKPETLYRVQLIFQDGNIYSGLPLCNLVVNSKGKAELRHSFDAGNIEGYGKTLEECLAVAVIVAGGPGSGTAPLCGYKDRVLPWRSGFKKLEKRQEEEYVHKQEPKNEPIVKSSEMGGIESGIESEIKAEVETEIKAETKSGTETKTEAEIKAEIKAEIESKIEAEIPPVKELAWEVKIPTDPEVPKWEAEAPKSKELDSEETDPEETDSKELDLEELDPKELDSEETDQEEFNQEEFNPKESNSEAKWEVDGSESEDAEPIPS